MSKAFDDLADVVARLRSPNGCPWDIKQTHESLKPFLLEEAYEVLEALDQDQSHWLREELGDLFLQVLLHAQIETEKNEFTIQDVMIDLQQKLVRRHPHVFQSTEDDATPLSPDEVTNQWEKIKQAERTNLSGTRSILEGIPSALPALLRASQIQTRASRVGFDWEEPNQVVEKLDEELNELRVAEKASKLSNDSTLSTEDKKLSFEAIEQEFGDVLFTVANLARFLKINPEESLRKAINRFVTRFQCMETQATQEGKALQDLTPQEWDVLWREAKSQEQSNKVNPPSSTLSGIDT